MSPSNTNRRSSVFAMSDISAAAADFVDAISEHAPIALGRRGSGLLVMSSLSGETDNRPARHQLADHDMTQRVHVHPDVAARFVDQAIDDGAIVPNPPELDGAFRLALAYAYARMGGDPRRF